MSDNIVLGRGKVYFQRFAPNTDTPIGGERFLGNCPAFGLQVETQELEHFRSTEGLREKDLSVTLQIDVSGTITTDNCNRDNIAAFFFGSKSTVTQAAASAESEDFTAYLGQYFQLGTDAQTPAGKRNITVTAVAVDPDGTNTALTLGTDFTVDSIRGRLYIVPTSAAVSDGDTIRVTYDVGGYTKDMVVSGTDLIYGGMRFLAFNGVGEQTDFWMPKIALRPNGEYALIGEDWQQFSFNMEVLKLGDLENIYADGQPYNLV